MTSHTYERRWLTLGVLSLSLVIIGLDNTILNVTLPTLQRTFDASASEMQWMVDAYILVFAGLLLTMGALGDRFGRAKALTLGLLVFGVASLFAAHAPSAAMLITFRGVMGIGGALIMPSTLSIVVDVFRGPERGKAIAVWAGVAGLGIGLGPLVGGLLLEHFWWGSVFLVNVPIVAAALVLGRFLVPESRDPDARPLDLPGAVLSMTAVSSLVYAIIEAPDRGWADPIVLAGFGGAVLLGILFALRERSTRYPMLDFAFFRDARFSGGVGAISVGFMALFGTVFLLTQYLQLVQGYSALQAGLRTAPVAIGIALGSGFSHLLVRRFGTTRVVVAGLLGLASVLTSMSLWEPTTPYTVVGFTFVAQSFFLGLVMAPATDSVMGSVPPAKTGVGSAMNDVTRQVGGALGVAVLGSVATSVYGSRMAGVAAGFSGEAAHAVADSIGAATRVAASLPADAATNLLYSAHHAFVDAFGVATLIGAAIAVIGAIMVGRFLPSRERAAIADLATEAA